MDLAVEVKLECSARCHRLCNPEQTAQQVGGIGIANLMSQMDDEAVSQVSQAQLEVTCMTGPNKMRECRAGVRIGLVDAQQKELIVSYLVRQIPPELEI